MFTEKRREKDNYGMTKRLYKLIKSMLFVYRQPKTVSKMFDFNVVVIFFLSRNTFLHNIVNK